MSAQNPSSPPKPAASNKVAILPIASVALESYSMTTSETKAPDKKSEVIKQAAHPDSSMNLFTFKKTYLGA
jgi:hypothetical protein